MKTIFLLLSLIVSNVHAQMDSMATISISSNYSDASIWIDDQETGFKTPSVISGIKIGQHKVILRWIDVQRHTEYVAEQPIVVKNVDTNCFFIEFSPVSVTIVCNAENTKLFLNGQLKGEGHDLIIDRIIPGTYHLRLTQPFGVTAEKSVYFPPNSSDCPPECFVFGNLRVESDEIQDTPIFINGRQTDKKIPATFNSLIIGEYEVGIKIKDKIVSKKIVVKMNEENYVRVNPNEIAKEIKEQELARKTLKKAQKEKEEKERQKAERLKQEQESIRLIEERKIKSQKREKLYWHKGVSVGLNYFRMKNFNDQNVTYRTDYEMGMQGGAHIAMPIQNLFYIQTELKIQRRNFEIFDVNRHINHLLGILLIKKSFVKDSYLSFGTGAGFLLSNNKINFHLLSAKIREIEYFGQGVIGFGLSKGIFAEIQISKPFTKLGTTKSPLDMYVMTYAFSIGISY